MTSRTTQHSFKKTYPPTAYKHPSSTPTPTNPLLVFMETTAVQISCTGSYLSTELKY